jgi:hypothetical protein
MDGSPPVRLGLGQAWELSRDGKWALAIRDGALVALPTAEATERVLATGFSAGVEALALTSDATAYAYSYRQFRSDLYLVKGLR